MEVEDLHKKIRLLQFEHEKQMADVSDINIRNSNNNEINYLKYSNLGKKE